MSSIPVDTLATFLGIRRTRFSSHDVESGVRGGVEYVVVVIKKKLRQCFCKLSTSGRAFFLVCLSSLFRFWLDVLNHIKHGKIGLLNTLMDNYDYGDYDDYCDY